MRRQVIELDDVDGLLAYTSRVLTSLKHQEKGKKKTRMMMMKDLYTNYNPSKRMDGILWKVDQPVATAPSSAYIIRNSIVVE